MKKIILGAGFLGSRIAKELSYDISGKMINQINDLDEFKNYEVIINCIGATGRPNVDWCEDHKPETYFANVHVPYLLAEFCSKNNIKLVHLSSGCVYSGDNNGKGWSEIDKPNFDDSYYSHTKIVAERLLSGYDNVLQLRIRMPFDKESSDRDLLSKLIKYDRLISIPNSLTVIDDFIFILKELLDRGEKGIFNCVNSNPITAKQIIDIYQEEFNVDLNKEYIPIEELDVKAPRSNCVLNTDKLKGLGLEMLDVFESVRQQIKILKEKKENK